MADPKDRSGDDVAREYRRLPPEEPPAHLDAAIRAEARRALETHAAPLVPPTGRRSWAFPIAAAAVIMLAVGITIQIERQDEEAPAPPAAPQAKPAESAARQEAPAAPVPKHALRDDAKMEAQATDNLAKTQPASPATPPAVAERRMQSFGAAAVEPPERWLERIAELRKAGKDEEADRQLAEFRKRYPDFRIAPEMLEKVERR